MTCDVDLPKEAWLVGLSTLPRIGPRRLASLLATESAETWWCRLTGKGRGEWDWPDVVRDGGRTLLDDWRTAASRTDLGELWRVHRAAGLVVLTSASLEWPDSLVDDHDPPALLFGAGDISVLELPTVAMVGTRRCTRAGAEIARTIGRDLAEAGVAIVSGLALGIDGAAHAGALQADGAPPIGVVGNGLDVVYPRRHAQLYTDVAERGLLLSEYPLGAEAKGWTFPARNRIVAALAEVVVVVESHQAGGSQYTVDEAIARDTPVAAVPGSVLSKASSGTNRMLADGVATAVCDASDVLALLGWGRTESAQPSHPEPVDDDVFDAVGFEPTSFEQVAVRTGLPLGQLRSRLDSLAADGWVVEQSGWFERSAGGVRR